MKKDRYLRFDGIDKEASRLIYGTGTPRIASGDEGEALACLDRAWESGFRTFDTAHSYGLAEERLGAWMAARGVRDELVLVDKGCNPGQKGSDDTLSAETIRRQVRQSQERLQTDHFEFYLLHRDDKTKPVAEVVEVLNELKDEGVIDYFGVSNWEKERIQEAALYAREHGLEGFSVISPSFSLADLSQDLWGGSVTISGDDNADFRVWLEGSQMPVFNYSSLARGYLSGRYDPEGDSPIEDCLHSVSIREYDSPSNRGRLSRAFALSREKGCSVSQICLAWVLGQRMNLFPIVSPSSTRHMEENMAALDLDLSDEELAWLQDGERA